MKKLIYSLLVLFVSLFAFNACENEVPEYNEAEEGKASKVKSLTFKDAYWEETFTFTYREDGKVSSILNTYEGGGDEILFDWSVPGKLSITKEGKTSVYEVDANGHVTQDPDEGYYNRYEYDEDGILIKVTEYWDGGSEVKFDVETKAGNVLKHKRVRDGRDYEKVFNYAPGLNLCDIQQTNPVDSYWKNQSGIYGKASNRLVYSQANGYLDEEMSSVKLEYEFDDFRRPSSIARSGHDWSEMLTYTYVD